MQCINSNLLRYANHSLITTPSTNKNNKVSPDANGDVKMPFILGKMKKKKELLNQIIKEAEEYIQAFYEKRKVNCEASKATNKETEKVEEIVKFPSAFLWNIIHFNISKLKRMNVNMCRYTWQTKRSPKPGKPTNLARMHQMILKLQQNPLPPKEDNKDGKSMKDGEDAKIGKISTPTATKDGF
ncbi:hypothetical protein Ahy_A03g015312 [Arachis hypogaea]|uniref:Uncharacterized protein n=1 Tax=Arachis hypogaea TaxID=3818 RepID=A0A445E040_ARAHY|nr:hypothetical protein Ahy_A03g015312 [Arachis hypogaea]